MLKTFRRHANDGVLLVTERDRLANDVLIAGELFLPESIAQDRHQRRAESILIGCEIPTERRPRAHHAEVIRRDQPPRQTLRLTSAGQRRLPAARERHRLERLAARAPVQKVRVRDHPRRNLLVPLRHPDQPVGVFERQRTEQHCIDDAEDRGVRANAQRKREYSHNCEALVLEQHSHTKPQVLKHLILQSLRSVAP